VQRTQACRLPEDTGKCAADRPGQAIFIYFGPFDPYKPRPHNWRTLRARARTFAPLPSGRGIQPPGPATRPGPEARRSPRIASKYLEQPPPERERNSQPPTAKEGLLELAVEVKGYTVDIEEMIIEATMQTHAGPAKCFFIFPKQRIILPGPGGGRPEHKIVPLLVSSVVAPPPDDEKKDQDTEAA
jgi:hypothetical protein